MKNLDLFRPEFFLLAYLAYIAIAYASFKLGFVNLIASGASFLIPIFSFAPFLLGIAAGKFCYGKKIPRPLIALFLGTAILFYTAVFNGLYQANRAAGFVVVTILFLTLFMLARKSKKWLLPKWQASGLICAVGTFLVLLAFWQVGIPATDFSLRWSLTHNSLFGAGLLVFLPSYALLLQSIREKPAFFAVFLLATGFFMLTTLRWVVLFVFLTAALTAYYRKFIGLKGGIASAAAAFLIILFVSYFIHSGHAPLQNFVGRIGETHFVFSEMVKNSYPSGLTGGALFFNGNPRDFIALELFGYRANLTYTLLGAPMLEFGIAGVFAFMLLLGFLLSIAHNCLKEKDLAAYYPLLFSISLVWLEIGMDQFSMLFFAFFALLYFVKFSDI